ncbi:DUF2085 domain-containing protein [Rosettibacter firmus]|uniref:DUF2085 domain-containing protein n=1 Tax=Rosettibacter firmus TaxID=3111522 RepID=UPI00336BD6F0
MKLTIRLILFLITLIWCIGFLYECLIRFFPFLISYYPFIKKTYSLVCHQDSKKLIELSCGNLLVCSRCTGIYAGSLIISFVLLFTKKIPSVNKRYFYLALILLVTDALSTTIHLYNYSRTLAFFTGLFFGSILFLYFYKSLINLFSESINK